MDIGDNYRLHHYLDHLCPFQKIREENERKISEREKQTKRRSKGTGKASDKFYAEKQIQRRARKKQIDETLKEKRTSVAEVKRAKARVHKKHLET